MIDVDLFARRRREREVAHQAEIRDRIEIGRRLVQIEQRVERLERQVGAQPVDDGTREVDDDDDRLP